MEINVSFDVKKLTKGFFDVISRFVRNEGKQKCFTSSIDVWLKNIMGLNLNKQQKYLLSLFASYSSP